jgi:hypothetical protein
MAVMKRLYIGGATQDWMAHSLAGCPRRLACSLAVPRELPCFTAIAAVLPLPNTASCGLVGSALERELKEPVNCPVMVWHKQS